MLTRIYKVMFTFLLGVLCLFSLSLGIVAIACIMADQRDARLSAMKLQAAQQAETPHKPVSLVEAHK